MSVQDTMKALLRAGEEKKKKAELEMLPEDKLTNDIHLGVYAYIRLGHIAGNHARPLIGATGPEVCSRFPDYNQSTLRYAIWTLNKQGFITDSGNTRAFKIGSGPSKVWTVTYDYPEYTAIGE